MRGSLFRYCDEWRRNNEPTITDHELTVDFADQELRVDFATQQLPVSIPLSHPAPPAVSASSANIASMPTDFLHKHALAISCLLAYSALLSATATSILIGLQYSTNFLEAPSPDTSSPTVTTFEFPWQIPLSGTMTLCLIAMTSLSFAKLCRDMRNEVNLAGTTTFFIFFWTSALTCVYMLSVTAVSAGFLTAIRANEDENYPLATSGHLMAGVGLVGAALIALTASCLPRSIKCCIPERPLTPTPG